MPYLKIPKPTLLASVVVAAVANYVCSPGFAIELGVAALSGLQLPRFAVPTDLGVLPGGVRSEASGIDSASQVVGESDNFVGFSRAVRWQPRSVRNLGTMPKTTDSFASAINSSGTVVGYSGDSLGKSMHSRPATGSLLSWLPCHVLMAPPVRQSPTTERLWAKRLRPSA